MLDIGEQDYLRGRQAAWRSILKTAIGELSIWETPKDLEAARAVAVLSDVRFQLQSWCRELGIPWEDNLHLADVIEKRIRRHFES